MLYQRQAKPSEGKFLSWSDGEAKDLVILSEHATKEERHWVEGKSQDCTGLDCALCKAGVRKVIRWTVDAKCAGEAFPWSMSNTTYVSVEDVAEMTGALRDLQLRVSRHGTGRNTRYTVMPLSQGLSAQPIERTKEALVKDIQGVSKALGLDIPAELHHFLAEVRTDLKDKPTQLQLEQFSKHLHAKWDELEAQDKGPEEEEEDIYDIPF